MTALLNLHIQTSQQPRSSSKEVGWESKPGFDFVVNVDGCSLGNPGQAGFGALMRGSEGNWISGVYGFIGGSDNLKAEIYGLCFGLNLAWNHGVKKLLCYLIA